eukprot:jgi/Mesvir1/5108/Mv15268-RA.1
MASALRLPTGSSASRDRGVQCTNDDACISKISCVNAGYFRDDFVGLFVRRATKRSPLINRGYYARWAAIRRLLTDFLLAGGEAAGPKQVLSLGAGYDTAYFQTHSEGTLPSYRCFELDYLEVTRKKAMFIQQNERLRTRLGETATIDPDKGHVHSPGGYHLLPVDLRDVDAMEAALSEHGFDYSLPTFILSECVLVYLKPEAGEALVRWGASRLRTAVFVLYEQILPDDSFGQQMLRNLESRGCALLGIHATKDLGAHQARFQNAGWQRSDGYDMDTIYCHMLDKRELQRIERLEIFDEFEEWHLIQQHYCIAYGINDDKGILQDFGFKKASAT